MNKWIITVKQVTSKCGQNKLYNPVYGFMSLVRRGDNPNKETLIYIPYIPCRHNLSVYNPSYPKVKE